MNKKNTIYRAGTLKRVRRTNAELEQLDQQIIDVLAADHPQSVRHVFYRMTDPRLPQPVEKSDKGYRHVQDRCAKLRLTGRLPYSWIADMSRRGYFTHTFSGAGDFVRRMASLYRADLWSHADVQCEVWCESRSIASVIQDDCNDLAVDLYPCGGFASPSFMYEAAQSINRSGDSRPLHVFYVGDYDPAGVLIDQNVQKGLREHLNADIDLVFTRIGINQEQIALYDLPTKPRKAGDVRSQHVKATVEAEALPAHLLREMLRSHVEALLPQGALDTVKIAEKSERDHLRLMAGMFDEGV